MKRVRLIGLAIMAMLVLSAVAAATASAENVETLPVPTSKAPLTFSSKNNNEKNVLEGEVAGSAIECKTSAKCNSLSDSAGTILVTVGWHLVALKISSVLRLAIVATLVGLLHVECGATLLILVGNNVIGLFTKVAASGVETETGEVAFTQTKGVQELKTCELDKAFCSGKTFGLYAELGKGREKAGEQSEDTITLGKKAAFDY
jgi:hypothetical protein